MRVFYFGCHQGPGHFFWAPGMHQARDAENLNPWGYAVDGTLCPGYVSNYGTPGSVQVEGHAALHHKNGWTALAFWDRSVDKRGMCNSVFLAEGAHDFEAMVRIAQDQFPQVWARFTFEVRLAV